ncbi:uncharacterized protein [Medicago truncatula]|uniref:uncharacterized protein n=1 Tax=Medicago truncatula TaxID=3880 RepID=UPI0019677C9A|nr:uncharacterized protein LOC120579970 [Medicago truncatula]
MSLLNNERLARKINRVFDNNAFWWVWLPDPFVGYSVRGSYHMLTSRDVPLRDPASSLIWHNQVPLKVSLFAWRLLRDRLSIKANLVQRRVLDSEASLCVSDCGMSETAQHLFLSCDAFSSLWPLVHYWLGILGVDINVLLDHFLQFVNLTGGGKAIRDFFQLIWLLCVWVLWNERNNRFFNNVVTSIPRLLDKVKYMSLAWLKANKVVFRFGSDMWCSSPLQCLGIT